ncbi:hypothetical protein D9611_000168 [Ephemerocybe angulata]|uniref:Uncharacterized protein n=2 Tax=Ephemerocybe angulata TaxID=980116 RepID=A0A8H6I9Y8_9AGAR|nr:hypothetical protein D9611_000168 [Tulosesus angulatus]KAF6760006.1 hypothetical protein DFP72DRAFT_92730 [Tulosesus angulatus]
MPAVRNEAAAKAQRSVRPAQSPNTTPSTDPSSTQRARVPVQCPTCEKVVNRKADLTRHMQVHNKGAERYTCPYQECTYATLQKSNLTTHLRTHTGEKRFSCQDSPGQCDFRTSDPAAFTRHRKKKHGYVPQARSRKGSIATELESSPAPSTSGPSTGTPFPQDPLIRPVREVKEPTNHDERQRQRASGSELPRITVLEDDDDHPSPMPSEEEENSGNHSDSSESSVSTGPRSTRVCSRESSVSEVDDFLAKTIDSLKHVVGRRQRGASSPTVGKLVPVPVEPLPSGPASAIAPAPQRHPPISFERRGSVGGPP